MKMEIDRTHVVRGVTSLQYVGDDGLPASSPTRTLVAVAALSLLAYLVLGKRKR